MERASLHRVAGVAVGTVLCGVLYWLASDFGLAVATGIVWGCSTLVTLRIARRYPSHTTGTAWEDRRWTALGAGCITLAALVGVSPALQVPADVRFALGLLVVGVGFLGYTAGTIAELDREVARAST